MPLNAGRTCAARHPQTGQRCTRRWMHWGQHRTRPDVKGLVLKWFGSSVK
jgi:hypothetical protein